MTQQSVGSVNGLAYKDLETGSHMTGMSGAGLSGAGGPAPSADLERSYVAKSFVAAAGPGIKSSERIAVPPLKALNRDRRKLEPLEAPPSGGDANKENLNLVSERKDAQENRGKALSGSAQGRRKESRELYNLLQKTIPPVKTVSSGKDVNTLFRPAGQDRISEKEREKAEKIKAEKAKREAKWADPNQEMTRGDEIAQEMQLVLQDCSQEDTFTKRDPARELEFWERRVAQERSRRMEVSYSGKERDS